MNGKTKNYRKRETGENKPMYHIDRMIKETDEEFGDCLHIIYVNGAYKDNSPLGLLIQDFHCSNPGQMHYKKLADRARYLKEDEEEIKKMSGFSDEIRREEKEEIAIRLLERGEMTWEEIAEVTRLALNDIKELAEEIDLMPV